VQVLNDQVARCDVLIAVIGKNWLAATDETGGRRLDNPDDFVRVEIESALAQKKRVIPVLVNDAKMPRSTELPEGLKPFARRNAVRLTHDRFRADTQGLIKALEQVLAEGEAARRGRAEDSRRAAKARAKEEAERASRERREQSRKEREAKLEKRAPRIMRDTSSTGIVDWIAGLPSEISWSIPIAVLAILLVGWVLPGKMFRLAGLGWGSWSLLYAVLGLLAIGVMLFFRRTTLGGAELALHWFAAVMFYAVAAISVVTSFSLYGTAAQPFLTSSLPL
jgi:hypothetical protein